MKEDKILESIYAAIDIVNSEYLDTTKLEKSKGLSLIGDSSILDSLGLVTLIVEVEEQVEKSFSKSIVLADEKAMSRKNSPFKDVESLALYISEILG